MLGLSVATHAADAMYAFGKASPLGPPAFGSFEAPALGSLHARYVGLPANASCEVLLSVRASSVSPSDVSPRIAGAGRGQ